MYEYPCRLIRIINGNTIEADIDLGFNISIRQKIRLYGIDETDHAKAILQTLLPREFLCKTVFNKRGKVGRVLGHLFKEDASGNLININDMMIIQGVAKKFD